MRIEGEHTFRAPRQRVWDLLQDPEAIRRALPGVERFDPAGPDAYEVTMRVGVAAVRGTYRGRIAMTDLRPPERYTLRVGGQGTTGTIEATAEIRLAEQDGLTRLHYVADAQVGGLIAGVGQRMLGGVAELTARQFFSALEEQLLTADARPDGDAARAADAVVIGAGGSAPTREPSPLSLLGALPESLERLVPAMLVGSLIGFLLGRRRLGSAPTHADGELAAAIRDLADAIRGHRR